MQDVRRGLPICELWRRGDRFSGAHSQAQGTALASSLIAVITSNIYQAFIEASPYCACHLWAATEKFILTYSWTINKPILPPDPFRVEVTALWLRGSRSLSIPAPTSQLLIFPKPSTRCPYYSCSRAVGLQSPPQAHYRLGPFHGQTTQTL